MTTLPTTPTREEGYPEMSDRAKELLAQILAAQWSVDKHSLWINVNDVPKGPMHAADVRGWGFLTGRGHAHALDSDSAFLVQKAMAHHIVEAVNLYSKKCFECNESLSVWCPKCNSEENARLAERVRVLEGEKTPGADEAFAAIDLADNLIERAYGTDIPVEWKRAFRKVARARSALSQKDGEAPKQ